jgi:preprotein translocase subunit YajC
MDTILQSLPLLQQAGGSGQLVTTFVTFGLVFVIFYFLIIRPQNKKQKEARQMLSALKKGDRVATIGGIRGIVHSVKDDSVVLKVDDNTKIEFSKSAVATILNASKAADAGKSEKKEAQVESSDAKSETKE